MKLSVKFLILLILFSLSNCKVEQDSNFIEIEQILEKPAAYANKGILIQGVVNRINPGKQLFSVISQKEFKECGIADCNINEQLPVRYTGELPEVGKLIEITGTLKKIEKGFIYEAESIRNVENL